MTGYCEWLGFTDYPPYLPTWTTLTVTKYGNGARKRYPSRGYYSRGKR